jgi:hypothetical protein
MRWLLTSHNSEYPITRCSAQIVLSDGYPACENNSSRHLLQSYLLELSKRHPIFGIGIKNTGITSLYPHAENITDLGCLQSVVLGRLREFILRHAVL